MTVQEGKIEFVKARARDDSDAENWIVAYADLITLLFIFFSLLLSISVLSRAKLEAMSHQFNEESSTSLTDLKKQIDEAIHSKNLTNDIHTQFTDEGLEVHFSEGVLFATAEASLNDRGQNILQDFSAVLKGIEKHFQLAVEGHTDSRPIHTVEFPSNWSLSAARSVNVLHLLKAYGIDDKRMMSRAHADTRPVSDPKKAVGDDPAAKDRRVTLLVY